MLIASADLRSGSEIQAARALFKEYAEALPFGLGCQNFEAELAGLLALYVSPSGCLLFANEIPALSALWVKAACTWHSGN